jgi:hypothetical protein
MDRYGNYDRQEDDNVYELTQDAAVEAPPVIGTDERRMHVRAYNYWASLLNGRTYPSIEDLEPESLNDFGPHSVLLDFSTGADNPAIAYLGAKLREECNLSGEVRTVDDVPSRSLISRLTDHYLQIIANKAPIGFEAEFVNHRGNNTLYRGILMPFSSDDDTIDFIYGVINWKEIADEALTAELNDAVEQALAQQPVRHAPTAPVWADGPSAAIDEPCIDDGSIAPKIDLGMPVGFDTDDEDEDFDEEPVAFDGSEGLGDLLHAARTGADIAKQAEGRSRAKLYRALGLAYDFALVADARPDEYAELLTDSGLKAQDRAPMTPIVKLVFGIDYDKTRLAEFGAALSYARKQALGVGEFTPWLESFPGALKGIVAAERAERNPTRKVKVVEPVNVDKARTMPALGVIQLEAESEFVVLIARKIDDGHVAVIGKAGDETLVDKALRTL